ncbi:MAG: hypothetical protein J3R72DRAFT_446464 [Linnemannia gamsii]|nr:MAG: hypothetical protein J3R72DRAFT_446464 [Linnemannia gamsii]
MTISISVVVLCAALNPFGFCVSVCPPSCALLMLNPTTATPSSAFVQSAFVYLSWRVMPSDCRLFCVVLATIEYAHHRRYIEFR